MFTQWQLRPRRRYSLLWLTLIFSAPACGEKCANNKSCRMAVNFTGIYLENTCEISIDGGGADNTVLLPKISTARLQRDGEEAASQQFQISLKSCPAGKKVNLHFVSAGSSADGNTGNLMNRRGIGMSEAVQVRLRNEAGRQMYLDNATSFQPYIIPSSGDDVTHYYMASYYANGTRSVTAGLVNAVAGIELIYN